MEPIVEFVGWKVGKGEEVSVAQDLYDDHESYEMVHTTQVALGPSPQRGRHTVFVTSMSGKFAIGTLEMGRCEQFSVDFMAADDMKFSHTGDSDVHITGYKTLTTLGSDDEGPQYVYGDEDDEDDEEAPSAIPLNGKQLKVARRAAALDAAKAEFGGDDDEDDEDDDDDDEEDDELDQEEAELLQGAEFSDMDDDDDDDDEEEEDDEPEDVGKGKKKVPAMNGGRALPGGKQQARAQLFKGTGADEEDEEDDEDDDDEEMEATARKMEAQIAKQRREGKAAKAKTLKAMPAQEDDQDDEDGDEDDDDEDDLGLEAAVNRQLRGAAMAPDDDEDDEDEDDEDEEEDEEEEAEPAPKANAKRPAGVAKTPQPAKRPKKEAGQAASAPAKVPAAAAKGGKSGGDVAEYEAKLKAAIKEHKGSMSMATLGSAVKRPAAVPKLKKFLEEHAAFRLDEKGNVSLC